MGLREFAAGLIFVCLSQVSGFVQPHACQACHGRSLQMSTASPPAVENLTTDGGVTRKVLSRTRSGGKGLGRGDIALVKYTGTVQSTGKVFSKGDAYRSTVEDGTMISGWDVGLTGLLVGDKVQISCTSRYGYGDEGVEGIIPGGSDLVFDVELLENEGNIMNPASFADANPLTPRTPGSIRDTFQKKRELQAQEPTKEGFMAFVDWYKGLYIFGLFEGQTGQKAPWYLRPVITFPIMFAICGVAFAGVFLLNGITSEKSTTIVDDVDLAMTAADYYSKNFS